MQKRPSCTIYTLHIQIKLYTALGAVLKRFVHTCMPFATLVLSIVTSYTAIRQ